MLRCVASEFKPEDHENLIKIITSCSQAQDDVHALRKIGSLGSNFSWVLSRMPDYSELTTTALSSIADIIEQLSATENSWAAEEFATNETWNLF